MDYCLDLHSLGRNVQQYRKERGYSTEKLSELSGISKSHINNIESSRSNASPEVLVRIANSLSVTVDMLLYESQDRTVLEKPKANDHTQLLEDCTEKELKLIINTARALKASLMKLERDNGK